MQYFSIPACYFPSTAVFIDNSRDFLLNFVLHLDEGLAYRVFDSAFDALDFIQKKRCELEVLNRRCINEYTQAKNSPLAKHRINLNLAAVHAEVYNSKRFSEISVVVIDYAMPGMDGIEFCKQIENTNIKKILLINETDEHFAIKAMAKGIIHSYVNKNHPDCENQIIKSVYNMQLSYFQSMSDMIVRMLTVTPLPCLHNQSFAELFWKLCREKGIVEFYLADNKGSFLMLDDDANISFLIVRTEADLHSYYDLAKENGASKEVLDQLLSREKIPCFWESKSLPPQWNEWSNCMVPANKFGLNETYYYAFVQGAVLFDVRLDKILSYHQYLEELDAEELFLGKQ